MPSDAFVIRFDRAMRDDLVDRLNRTRWSDAAFSDWSAGTETGFLRALVDRWRAEYDFDEAERRLNEWPQQRVPIDGFSVHVVRLAGRGPNPKPLLLMNGWPSSFVEYRLLAPMLADPAAFGGSAEDAFDVVMPALPGFGFSDRPARLGTVWPEDVFHRLMTDHFGYRRYVASGTDIGAGVGRRLGLAHPDAVAGIHLASVADPPVAPNDSTLTEAERDYRRRAARWEADEGAYEHVHYTRPQTLSFALADSPARMASWIVEKFHGWSDHGGDLGKVFPVELILDNLTIYWATGTIGSSIRAYHENARYRSREDVARFVAVPTAVSMWPKDLVTAPREWAARLHDVRQYTAQKRGGHFPAYEAPDLYADDLRRFARSLSVA